MEIHLSRSLLICFLLFIFSCGAGKKTTTQETDGEKDFKTTVSFDNSPSLSDVLEKAARENKLIFLDIYTTWCLPCKLMDKEVYPDKKVSKFLNENFINYKVDAEKGEGITLAEYYQIQAYPTLLFMDSEGTILKKKVGVAFQKELMEMGKSAMDQVGL